MGNVVAALFVECDGIYCHLPDVEAWELDRDGAAPVVAHPPCHLWVNFAALNFKRYGGEHNRPGNDGGCFVGGRARYGRAPTDITHASGPGSTTSVRRPRIFDGSAVPARIKSAGNSSGLPAAVKRHGRKPLGKRAASMDEFREDPDFCDDYRAGVYNVTCEECHGRNVVDVIDTERMPAEAREALYGWWQEEAADRRYSEMERRMGA